MKAPPTVVLELVETSPPLFRVLTVDAGLITKDNLTVGELLNESAVDFLFESYGDYGVEVRYPH